MNDIKDIGNLIAHIKELPDDMRTYYEDVILGLHDELCKLRCKDQEMYENEILALHKELEKYERYCRAFSGDFS